MDITEFLFKIISGCFPNPQQREETDEEEQETESEKSADEISSPKSEGFEYEVFLSFRGPDTRTGFTSHLYRALVDAGFHTFRDDNELRVGKEIGPDLLQAIHQSKISIPIMSRSYAHSKWCLIELTEMLKCNKHSDQRILPIFYDVTPDVVKHQRNSYQEAFLQHEKQFDQNIVESWKDSLKQIAKLKGWEKDKVANGDEGELVRQVISEVVLELKKNNVVVPNTLVGMECRVGKLRKFVSEDCAQVRKIGIHGMGGIGKTTVAKFIYNEFCDNFQQLCCFVENVQETEKQPGGLERIHDQLVTAIKRRRTQEIVIGKNMFKGMKVLIVLDDVHEESKLKDFFGGDSGYLLGSGSKIIITTRSKDVLEAYGVHDTEICELEKMNDDDSLHLFCKHAFGSQVPNEGYEVISKDVVRSCHGLPLSLVVVGSYLKQKSIKIWKATSKKLKTLPDDKVLATLRISYDALDSHQKEIFLDIACHFIGRDRKKNTYAFYMWEDKEWFPDVEIPRLVALSLVKFEGCIFKMHGLLIELGRKIVREKSRDNIIGERSRIWSHEDATDVLYTSQGTRVVQTLCLEYSAPNTPINCFSNEMFKGLANLRYLQLDKANLEGDFSGLLSNLRWFMWVCGDAQARVMNFRLDKLVILDLSHSGISDGWEDWMQLRLAKNLKVLRMDRCLKITRSPDFSTLTKLERLEFDTCKELSEIDPSLRHLKCLTHFKLRYCTSVRELPSGFGSMQALTEVDLGHCRSLVELPPSFWELKSLVKLDISYSQVENLPNGIGMLQKLETLILSGCRSLQTLPGTVGNLNNLRFLYLRGAGIRNLPVEIEMLQKLEILDCFDSSLHGELPRGVWNLSSLKVLNLCGTKISSLPTNICGLSSLLKLDLDDCPDLLLPPELNLPSSLTTLSGIPSTVASLDSVVSLVNLTSLDFVYQLGEADGVNENPRDFSKLSKLRMLEVAGVDNVVGLNTLYQLEFLTFVKCKNLRCFPDLSNLKMLCYLAIDNCPQLTEIGPFRKLDSLEELELSLCDSVERILDLSDLQSLKMLTMDGLEKLHEINGLGGLTSLKSLTLIKCPSLEGLPCPSSLKDLHLHIEDCQRLLLEMNGLQSLTTLCLRKCASGTVLQLSNLKDLKRLIIGDLEKLAELNGLEGLTCLQYLELVNCPSVEKLPDLSNLKELQCFRTQHCEKLREINGIEGLPVFGHLDIENCPSLKHQYKLEFLEKRFGPY